MTDRLTPEREAERVQGLLYEAITAFQKTAHFSSLQHAQMRGYLAEHLTPTLLAELAAVRAERDQAVDERDHLLEWQRRVTEEVEECEDAADADPDTPNAVRLMIANLRHAMGGERS